MYVRIERQPSKWWNFEIIRDLEQLPYCCFKTLENHFLENTRRTDFLPTWEKLFQCLLFDNPSPTAASSWIILTFKSCLGFFFHLERLFPNIPHSIKFDHPLVIILGRTELQWCITHIFSPYVLSPKWLLLPWWVERGPYCRDIYSGALASKGGSNKWDKKGHQY